MPKKKEPQALPTPAASDKTHDQPKRSKRKSWIDVKKCGHCGGELKIVAAIMEISAIRKILGHLGLPDKPPDIAPARLPAQMSFA